MRHSESFKTATRGLKKNKSGILANPNAQSLAVSVNLILGARVSMIDLDMSQNHTSNEDSQFESDADVDIEDAIDVPKKYAVLLLNDDYTTMDFVIEVLERFFNKTQEEAMQIMLRVHQQGKGVAGVYSQDIAETKASQVEQYAQAKSFPLRCAVEESS